MIVMPGLVPGIHVLRSDCRAKNVDGRDKLGHDSILNECQRLHCHWLRVCAQ
jgi:hypothetical protein